MQPVLLPRYLICSLPAGFILAAIGLSRVMVNRALTAATFTVVGLYAIFSTMTAGQQVREDRQGAAADISKSFRPGDCVATNVMGADPSRTISAIPFRASLLLRKSRISSHPQFDLRASVSFWTASTIR